MNPIIKPIDDSIALPDNFALIKETDPAKAFAQMRDAIMSAPVNLAIWRGGQELLQEKGRAIFKALMENKNDALGKSQLHPDRECHMQESPARFEQQSKLLHEALPDDKKTDFVSFCMALKGFFLPGIQASPKGRFDFVMAESAGTRPKPAFHIDAWTHYNYQPINSDANHAAQRFLVTYHGPTTLFADNNDIDFDEPTFADNNSRSYQFYNWKSDSPTVWQAMPFDICLITKSGWPHNPVVHSAPFGWNEERKPIPRIIGMADFQPII